jgi:hypothetical protein
VTSAVVVAGITGAGKSTALATFGASWGIQSAPDGSGSHALVDPAAFRDQLAAAGVGPLIPGLSPMECAPLYESQVRELVAECVGQAVRRHRGWPLVIELTPAVDADVVELLSTLAAARYSVTVVAVTCAVEAAYERCVERYTAAQDAWARGVGNGGRTTSMQALAAQQAVITHLLSGDVDGMAGVDRVITVGCSGSAPLIVGHVEPSVPT